MIVEEKTIAIIGLGGLGGFVAEYAARLNFKKIILIDADKFTESNMNRQLLCTSDTLDTFKVDNYYNKIKKISNSEVIAIKEFFNEQNTNIINDCDLVFDCLDNIKTRLLLEKVCSQKNIPIVHGSIGDNFGNICLSLPNSKSIEKLYKNKEETKLHTQAHSVAIISSLQMELAIKYFLNKYDMFINKFIYIDLEDFEIKILQL